MINTTLTHAFAYSAIFAGYALVTLTMYPRLWLRHYPAAERQQQPPKGRGERIATACHGIFFIVVILLALPVLSLLIAYGAETDPAIALRHIAILGIIASLVDWLILDWLLLRYLQPQWLIPADTQASSWQSKKDIVKDAIGFPIGSSIAVAWGYVVSRFF
ncbi:MAG: hypothetical protein GKR91_09430 [Pseudomonadales bacterium]|nr:hypothetical protein [Pseudomonadales bacterium]